MQIRTVLVPIDFGESTAPLLDQAVDFAEKVGARVVVLHVWQIPVYGFPIGAGIPAAELGKSIEEAARHALDKLVAERAGRGVELEPLLRVGAPWEQILEVAKEKGADLIAMSTRGRKGLPRALLGSVAEKVIRMSEIPVLTLRIEGTT